MLSPVLMAQSEMTAVKLSNAEESNGSARYQALSGAMGAVGVDFSSVAQNPAGIALLRRDSRVDITFSYDMNKSLSQWYKNSDRYSDSQFNFDQISANFKIGTGASAWTFGIGLRNNGRSHRTLDATANGLDPYVGSSLADYSAARLNGSDPQVTQSIFEDKKANWFENGAGIPWIGAISYGAGWNDYAGPQGKDPAYYFSNYQYKNAKGEPRIEAPHSVGLVMNEDYSIREADFAFAYSLSPRVNIGFLLASSSFDYTLNSSYSEGYRPSTDTDGIDGLSLNNYQSITGVGAKLGFGLLVEPVNGLRLGASIYTPTFYTFEFDFNAVGTGHNPFTTAGEDFEQATPDNSARKFEMLTPWRLGLNAAYIIKKFGLVSLDYEFSTFGMTRLYEEENQWSNSNMYATDNEAIKTDFKGVHRLRLGVETNLSRRLSLRAGAKFEPSPISNEQLKGDDPKMEVLVSGTMVHYALPEGKMGLSAGFGYRITPKWSVDFAYVYAQQKAKVFAFPVIEDPSDGSWLQGLKPIKQTDQQHRMLLTIGYRF